MKKSLTELLKEYGGDEGQAIYAWMQQQPTHTVFEMFASLCDARIRKLEAFRRAARENAEMTLYMIEIETPDEEMMARTEAITRQRLRAISGEPPQLSDYEDYVKKYCPSTYEELCSKPERVFVASSHDLEKSEEEE